MISQHSVLASPDASNRVGISNSGQHLQQHRNLQVAQQHVQARLAFETPQSQSMDTTISQASSPQVTDEWRKYQHQQLDLQLDFLARMNAQSTDGLKIERSRSDQGPPHGFKPLPEGSSMMPITIGTSDLNARPLSSRSLGTDENSSSAQDWMVQLQRPVTPAEQISSAYSPMTPEATPTSNIVSKALRSAHTTPSSQNALSNENQSTVKARRIQSPNLLPATELSDNASPLLFGGRLPSPPPTVSAPRHYDATALTDEDASDSSPKFNFPPPTTTNALDFQSDPLFFVNNGSTTPMATYKRHQPKDSVLSFASQAPSVQGSDHSARSSVDFGANEMPMSPSKLAIGELSLEANMAYEDTGVTTEEIMSYITEDFSNIKDPFGCSWPDCPKRFGRRENGRSHIQTHLNDRPFRCLECDNRFVRLHDLKRHMKIHSKEKPYKCLCGNGFARQDALTRHRQRGICKGSFAGVVRTPVKRGRPRKQRPGNDARVDKATRQRKRNATRAVAASVSGSCNGPSQQPSPESGIDEDVDMDQGMSDEEIRLLRSAGSEAFTLSSPDTRYDMTPPMSRGQSSAGSPQDKEADDAAFYRLIEQELDGNYSLMGMKEPFGGPVEHGLAGFNDEALFPDLLHRY